MDIRRDKPASWQDQHFILGEGHKRERTDDIQEREEDKDGICKSLSVVLLNDILDLTPSYSLCDT